MPTRKRARDSKKSLVYATPLERLPSGIISSFILPYLNDYDVKNACLTEIIEIQQYAYRYAIWSIDEVDDVNRPFIQRVQYVSNTDQIKAMNQLIEIHFHDFFNHPLGVDGKSLLPNSLQTLTLGGNFDQPLGVDGQTLLPNSLQTLTFGDFFNRPLENRGQKLLPGGLHTLIFGYNFNQPLEVDGHPLLPDALKTLDLPRRYTHPLQSLLPDGLKTLKLYGYDRVRTCYEQNSARVWMPYPRVWFWNSKKPVL